MPQVQDEMLDTISDLIASLDAEANRLGLLYRVRSEWFSLDHGAVQIGRWKGWWALIWKGDDREVPLTEVSVLVKAGFLQVAEKFFTEYHTMAADFSSRAESSVEKGVSALEKAKLLK